MLPERPAHKKSKHANIVSIGEQSTVIKVMSGTASDGFPLGVIVIENPVFQGGLS